MTSDKFGSVRVADIFVGERQRKDLGDLKPLAGSIADLGQLQAVRITSWKLENGQHKLVNGGRRLGAAIARGDEYIDVSFTDERDPIKLMIMEFAENDQREDYTWLDRCDAVVLIHEALVTRHGRNWTQEQTAKSARIKQPLVSDYLGITALVRKGYTELRKAPDLGTARSMMRRINSRLADKEVEEIDALCSEFFDGHKITPKSEIPIITADFAEWVKTYTGPKFNFLHCDFPYGIGIDKRNMGSAIDVHGGYDDTFENYQRLLEALRTNLDRICADSAHIMFWFSMHHYTYTLKFFEEHSNFKINPFPLIWVKPGTGLPGDYMHEPRRIYDTCLFGRRGDRVIVSSVDNAYVGPTDKSEDHPTAKSKAMLCHFFRMFVDENTKMLDPTCGSGTALRAAKSLGAAYVLGIENNEDYAERATKAFEKWVLANGNGATPAPPAPA
jgi:hypothetical protein